ncbi:methyltransferase domain-containing protein [Miltoncostaea marina]|uniref:methyltransferase domain-containing protein n=1 Tax=Miltoncostaea marina TaxID=2843215 RepID=UPI001C3E4778|nr:methyltransferase domain-containing protein [Miltoncostaea marina]
MTTMVQEGRAAAPWSLARRVVTGLVQPGGAPMARRALDGARLDDGDRVVELSPGLGLTSALVLERGPREWTAVEPDPAGAEHLGRTTAGAGRRVVEAPIAATGLADGSATVVVADCVLGPLDDEGRAAALAEAARLLRAGGRVALHELTPAEDAHPAALDELAGWGVRATGEDGWRAAMRAAGLVPIGAVAGRLRLRAPAELMRAAGPRTALRLTRGAALDADARTAATRVRQAVERHELALRSLVVVAEVPLVLGMRRPRR